MTDDIAYYEGLLSRPELEQAFCWTVVEPLHGPITIETVVERLGADPAQIRELPWSAVWDEPSGSSVVHLAQAGSAVMLAEANGIEGWLYIERLSEQARVHNALWTISSFSSLSCAAYGHLLVDFEGRVPDQRHGIDICALDEELGPLYTALDDLGDLDPKSVIMAIIERRTGVRFEERLLNEELPAIVLAGSRRGRPAGRRGLFDPELEAALRLAPSTAQQAFIRELAELLVGEGELADEPEARSALEALASGVPVGDPRYGPLEQLSERMTPSRRRWRAAWALQHTLMRVVNDPLPMRSLQTARLILGDRWLPARTRLRRRLLRP